MIVVIAILAAISVVAYRGVASNAQAAALRANLAQAANRLEAYRVDNGAYPPDQATVAGLLKLDSSTTIAYAANNSANPQTYCLSAALGSQQFSVGSANNTPSANACVVNLVLHPISNAGWATGAGVGGVATTSTASDGRFPGGLATRLAWTTAPTSGSALFVGDGAHIDFQSGHTYFVSIRFAASWSFVPYMYYNTLQLSRQSLPQVVRGDGTVEFREIVTALNSVSTNVVLAIGSGALPSAGDTLLAGGEMVTEASSALVYADGNSPGWSWTGTPNASTSIGPPL